MKHVKLAGSNGGIGLIVDGVVVVKTSDISDRELLGYMGFSFTDVVEEIEWLYDEPKDAKLKDEFLEKYREYMENNQLHVRN